MLNTYIQWNLTKVKQKAVLVQSKHFSMVMAKK